MLIKKWWCHCRRCWPRTYHDKSDGFKKKSIWNNSYKRSAHKQRVRKLRRARLNKDFELIFDKSVWYTD